MVLRVTGRFCLLVVLTRPPPLRAADWLPLMLWLDGSLIIRESWRTDDAAHLLLPSGWIAALPAAAFAADELDAVYEVFKVQTALFAVGLSNNYFVSRRTLVSPVSFNNYRIVLMQYTAS